MADKTYRLTFTKDDGSEEHVEFTSPQGPQGEQGPKGDQGIQGIQGEQGLKGDKGDKGDTGANGADGVSATHSWNGTTLTITSASGTSSANLKGDTGEQGPKGDKGDTGATGANGVSATHSWNGTTLTITSASGTSSANLKGDKGDRGEQGPKGDKGDTGATGAAGAAGKTPVKGVDYWTAADQEAIVQQVIVALGTPVFGTVDETGTINLTGALADGKTYTFTYEDDDGNIATIGTYTKAAGPAYTNQIPISTDTDGSVFNGKGYKANTRLNSSGVATNDGQANGWYATGFIPIVDGNTIRSSDGMFDKADTSGYQRVVFYKADKSVISEMKLTPTTLGSSTYGKYFSVSDSGALLFNLNVSGIWGSSAFNGTAAYCRIVAKYIDDNSIVTINEEIV